MVKTRAVLVLFWEVGQHRKRTRRLRGCEIFYTWHGFKLLAAEISNADPRNQASKTAFNNLVSKAHSTSQDFCLQFRSHITNIFHHVRCISSEGRSWSSSKITGKSYKAFCRSCALPQRAQQDIDDLRFWQRDHSWHAHSTVNYYGKVNSLQHTTSENTQRGGRRMHSESTRMSAMRGGSRSWCRRDWRSCRRWRCVEELECDCRNAGKMLRGHKFRCIRQYVGQGDWNKCLHCTNRGKQSSASSSRWIAWWWREANQ